MHKYKLIYILLIFFLYSSSSRTENINNNIKILENYLNTIQNMSFIFEQQSPNKQKETGWMKISKPNKLRIEYKGANDLIILSNSYYLILYKANDDIITSLPNDGPWSILTKNNLQFGLDINNPNTNGVVNNVKELKINKVNHIFYEILMKNQDNQLMPPIMLHTSSDPFMINGWTIFNEKNEATNIKILERLSFNKKSLNENIFKLAEQDRIKGDVWKGPFDKPQIVRKPKYRN
ncbi:outer membrane lipoprotein carrier protein LolA [Alphaproteobacteria bacterium]|nr:outer membrane lipoprotein carrier protein LolA [Alphaproteobacteria bacterium]